MLNHVDAREAKGMAGAVLALAVALLALAGPPVAIAEEPTHLYNATLSLTGNCATLDGDPVPDPGCPGGDHPPEGKFVEPTGVATDAHGNIYVVNRNRSKGPEAFHVDVFDSSGHYVTNVPSPGARYIVVDSTGHLYVQHQNERELVRFDPTLYVPATGEIAYGSPPVALPVPTNIHGNSEMGVGMAVDPTNDRFYLRAWGRIIEHGPPTDGVANEILNDSIGAGVLQTNQSPEGQIAIDAARGRLYSVDWKPGPPGERELQDAKTVIRALSLAPPHELLYTIDGSTTPAGSFGRDWPRFQLAADEGTGNLFAGHIYLSKKIYVLEEDGDYLATIDEPLFESEYAWIAVDDSELSPNEGFVFITNGAAQGRIQAYEPLVAPGAPTIESVSVAGVTETEAVLRATVNPEREATRYSFEYTTQRDFEENGFANAQLAGEGDIAASGEGVTVSAPAAGLSPGTAYRFRVVAENQCAPGGCTTETQGGFSTFPRYAQGGACANQALRTGASAQLPDCRAYELVTPANTKGRSPEAPNTGDSGDVFGTPPASPAGDSVAFMVEGGVIPGLDGAGGLLNGDIYVASRGASSWRSEGVGLNGTQTIAQNAGGLSADHRFAATEGSMTPRGEKADYVRYPDGSLRLVGEGSLGAMARVEVHHIAPGGSHIVFSTTASGEPPKQLEPAGPADGVVAIYDRTLDGQLHVVSLLPGDVTPAGGAPGDLKAGFLGISADGSAVAFEIGTGGPIYLRVDNSETLAAAPAGSTFAGLSENGRRMLYLHEGDLHGFDVASETAIPYTDSGDATPAHVAADGATAYFVSPSVLAGGAANPAGAAPLLGANNLYASREGSLEFVATVTESDVEGAPSGGFADWLAGVRLSERGLHPARTSGDGSVLLFESRADLAGFESAGRTQIYRFDANQDSLTCLSCDPIGAEPGSDATLLTEETFAPVNRFALVPNLSRDGQRAFFESEERLVTADQDGLRDVYEWEAQGKGSCAQPGGCLFLVSSGESARPDYLFGASETGDDVFISTADLLTGEDDEEARSIYDARVGGGFPPPATPSAECQGEACQPAAAAPNDATPTSHSFHGVGNVGKKPGARPCPKGKRAVRRAGKRRCVRRRGAKAKRAKSQRKRANSQRKRANSQRREGR